MGAIDITFTSALEKSDSPGGWTYARWADAKEVFGTGGAVKFRGTIDEVPFDGIVMAMGGGQQMIPVKTELRKVIGKEAGADVTIRITDRR